jgi:N-acetylglucosaminyldiphosphoundecaprenol N-acetyl-beta-D-mannosaminyltransferase
MEIPSIDILGIKVNRLDFNGTIGYIEEFIRDRTPRLVITLGTEMVMAARKNKEFRDVLARADIACADAVGIVWASRYKGMPLKEKVAGIDLLDRIVELSGEKGWRLFFLGAAEGVAEQAVSVLREKYSSMIVAGIHHGYFKDDDNSKIVAMIKNARADVLFVALGSPRQEFWFFQHKDEMAVPVGIGVGGSFDVLSGKLKRAPRWMIQMGLEWLYRLYLEPWRWKRMLVLPLFALQILFSRSTQE